MVDILDASIIAYIVRHNGLRDIRRAGVELDDFVDEWRSVYKHVMNQSRSHGHTPSVDALKIRFPDIEIPRVKKSDYAALLHDLKQRRKYMDLLSAVEKTVTDTRSYDDVDEAITTLSKSLRHLAYQNGKKDHIVDIFSKKSQMRMVKELRNIRKGSAGGIPTGLTTFDKEAGGLHRSRMVVAIGRTGQGKTWMDLLFVANAVAGGHKVLLFPLEMTLEETAFRLYTIFSRMVLGADKVIKNYDLASGHVTSKKLLGFFDALENKYNGQLLVADIGALRDPYTNERIDAEVEAHKPDMFWVDYLTLLKGPSLRDAKGYEAVAELSRGIKGTAMRTNSVGGCSAQVNREALKANVLLPRLEHIAYGDSIGQDANQVFSINRLNQYLYYSLVKNRHGPEIERVKMKFDVDVGLMQEIPDVDRGDSDDDN